MNTNPDENTAWIYSIVTRREATLASPMNMVDEGRPMAKYVSDLNTESEADNEFPRRPPLRAVCVF
jgi:hypothetical protein